ncbi:rhodanese-like domain-containing protein [Enterococcus sp.]|uniref:rhodanese-like domain-containing protein n=1 Tax=Enterococcus sp. TaxID=35783 RepID=UPI00289B336A|nr:rhodanese-like domain-containing protein [Enterococcus sp.]
MTRYVSQVFPNKPLGTDHYSLKLARETDIADLAFDFYHQLIEYTVMDVRSEEDFNKRHIPGAISCPNGMIKEPSSEIKSKIVVYCWGPSCNGSTKAASRLLHKGYNVKELIGGLEYWVKEGAPVEGNALDSPIYWQFSKLV